MRFPNIIFDFDGTLTDSRRDIAGAQLWALSSLGFNGFREEDIYPLIGKPLQVTFERLLPPEHHAKIPDAIALYAEYYPPRALATTTLFPGVLETLQTLSARGHRMAVASTKKGAGIFRVTEHFGITGLFDRLQGSDDINYKPAPDVIHAVLAHEHWAVGETLMVGDTDADILAGQAAGVATCAVTYGALAAAELAALDPDFIINSITALPAIVGGL
jgi:phosphoglycolate phosphatase